ncbi:CLUMA_CG016778, isoform A [Clunio marinus]|uniref:CLUMA_CG016778, isoform A n=1 Tax=Clunio marinus TaxID=568069 RepID=A0A1J1IS66_9DIPT|nr:CLUMA_CG016778, isoform A [Clunio marinus]
MSEHYSEQRLSHILNEKVKRNCFSLIVQFRAISRDSCYHISFLFSLNYLLKFPNCYQVILNMQIRKSDKISEALRNEGNKLYGEKRFYHAMLKYNESLCHTPLTSVNLGLAYANRSAIYFELRLYEKCLKNIKLAIDHNYPCEKLNVLNHREEKCNEMKHQKLAIINPWNFFKLTYKSHKKLHGVADCLQVRINEKYGKHIITTKPLHVGDIIAIEKPFCSVLLSESKFLKVDKENKFQRCRNCLKDNQLDLIPCSGCCEVMFCSDKCHQEANERFHKYECPVMNLLLKSGSVNIALQIFFIALSACDGSIENLQNFMLETENTNSTVFDYNFSQDSFVSNTKNYLKCLTSLTRSQRKFCIQAHDDILSTHPQLKNMWNENQEFIRNFIQKQCQINDQYFHGIFGGSLTKTGNENLDFFSTHQKSIGSGWFPFCSLINHSCAPNVTRVSVEGKVVLVVCRPIAEGSQLFDCYKANFNKQPKSSRQMTLLKEFNFTCDCEACDKNYPAPPILPIKDIKIVKFGKKTEEEIVNLKGGQSLKRYHDCCEVIDKNHDQNFPSLELSLLQMCQAMYQLKQNHLISQIRMSPG